MNTVFAICLLTVTAIHAQQPFISVDQMLQTLPVGLQLKSGKHWQPHVASLINKQLGKDVVGKQARLSVTLTEFAVYEQSAYGPGIRAVVQPRDILVAGASVRLAMFVYFPIDKLELLAQRVSTRSDLIGGEVVRCEVQNGKLIVDLKNAVFNPDAKPKVQAPKGVKIAAATYGTGNKQADVKVAVATKLENRQMLVVKPSDLGSDPAPGWNKRLHVTYYKDGIKRERSYGENEWVIWQSFWGPQDAEELKAWLPTVKFTHPDGSALQFEAGGTFRSAHGVGIWQTKSDLTLVMEWADSSVVPCRLSNSFDKLQEEAGGKLVFKADFAGFKQR